MKVRVLLWFICVSVSLAADTSVPVPDAIVDHYCAATKAQEVSIPGASMEVEIKGFLPKLKKYGNLHALRKISPLGLIKYERIFFEGDRTVNKEVIQRYMNAEIESQKERRVIAKLTGSEVNNGVPGGFNKLIVESTDQLWLTVLNRKSVV